MLQARYSACPRRPGRRRGRPVMHLPEWMRRRKELSGSGARPVLQTLTATVDNLKRVPTLPSAANRAMLVAKDPNSSLAQLAAVIERDPALAAGVLKLANSALYRTF